MSKSRALAGLTLIAAIASAFIFLPVGDLVRQLNDTLRSTGTLGAVAYVAIYAIATVFMVPGSALTLLAGMVYGIAGGMLVVVPASLLGATAAAMLGRTLLRSWVETKVQASPRAQALDRAIAKDGFKMTMLTRLSPVFPFTLLNYILGLTGVPMRTYILASAVGMFPGTLAYVYLGSLIPDVTRLVEGGAPDDGGSTRTILLIVGGVATLLLAMWLARVARRAIDEATELPADS